MDRLRAIAYLLAKDRAASSGRATMQEDAVFVVIEVVSVKDSAGLKTYIQRAS
jgi:hypothetical protein